MCVLGLRPLDISWTPIFVSLLYWDCQRLSFSEGFSPAFLPLILCSSLKEKLSSFETFQLCHFSCIKLPKLCGFLHQPGAVPSSGKDWIFSFCSYPGIGQSISSGESGYRRSAYCFMGLPSEIFFFSFMLQQLCDAFKQTVFIFYIAFLGSWQNHWSDINNSIPLRSIMSVLEVVLLIYITLNAWTEKFLDM